jgi:hypothetical protein
MGTSADGCRDAYEERTREFEREAVVIVVPEYRGHRIEVEAVVTGMRWNATVTIRRIRSRDPSRVEIVTCLKLTPELAESAGETWARRWVDLKVEEEAD